MRTRRVLAGAAFITLGLSTAAVQAQLRGSDTLEDVTKDAFASAGITVLTYAGGGSGAGEAAMVGNLQHLAPMSRELNSGTADTVKCISGTSKQLVIGLDGIAVVAANKGPLQTPQIGDSLDETATTADDCSDSISSNSTTGLKSLTGVTLADGVTLCSTAQGCSPDGTYTFSSWKDVLAMVYGGQNHNKGSSANVNAPTFTAAGSACTYQAPPNEAAADSACTAPQVCFPNNKCGDPSVVGTRNPAIVDCLNPVRQALVDSYGTLFTEIPDATNKCLSGTCGKLRHAFRRDDLSGTTDTFVGLVGLVAIANPTKALANNQPYPDRQANANPFCNGGPMPNNKGDTDYLDLDPIRRAVDNVLVNVGGANNRYGLEQVSEVWQSFGGNNSDANCMRDTNSTLAGVQPPIPLDHGSPSGPGVLVSQNFPPPSFGGTPSPANAQLSQMADLGYNSTAGAPDFVLPGLLAAGSPTTSTRGCLGLVLPITLPANYNTVQQAYFADATGNTVFCDKTDPMTGLTATASVNMETLAGGVALCPNGTRQPCDLPYKFDSTVANNTNFNCMQQQMNPNNTGVQDMRAFNLHPVNSAGHYLKDNYINTSIATTSRNGTACTTNSQCGNGTCTSGLCAGDTYFLSTARQARIVSAYYRIHMTRNTTLNGSVPTFGNPAPTDPLGTPLCEKFTSTDQIGCLVKANSCDIGYAGREAVDDVIGLGLANVQNFGLMIEGIRGSTQNIQNLALPPATPVYPIACKLWLNSINGFTSLTADETTLFNFEQVTGPGTVSNPSIDDIIFKRNFVNVPSGVTNRLKNCPAVFP